MNIEVHGKVPLNQKKTIKRFVGYVTGHFSFPKTTVIIKFIDPRTLKGQERKDLLKYQAWMVQNQRRKFTITISTGVKSTKGILLCVGHELVHAKQYLKGELVDMDDGSVKYKGKFYTDWEYNEGYWFSLWEVEAYGYQEGLYECFIKLPK